MDVDLDTLTPNNFYLGDTSIRAYIFIQLHVQENHPFPDPDTAIRWLQNYRPLSDPYTWLVLDEDKAAIVNLDDMKEYYIGQQSSSSSSTTTSQQRPQISYVTDDAYEDSDEDSSMQEAIDESFELEEASHVPCSGLTKKLISKNLRVRKYCEEEEEEEEEGEICVVCQVEFERNERVAALQCKHLYHQECIKEWLVRSNVCPLCKAQALTV